MEQQNIWRLSGTANSSFNTNIKKRYKKEADNTFCLFLQWIEFQPSLSKELKHLSIPILNIMVIFRYSSDYRPEESSLASVNVQILK